MSTKGSYLRADYQTIITGILVLVTVLAGAFLSSAKVNADDDSAVDQVSITIPVSCTLAGTGMNSHTAEILNGQYSSDIGTTTIKMFCNDQNGFALYAAGYTGDEIGATNSNKLVGVNTTETIITGTATSAGNPDVSNWAMKLTATGDSGDTTGTNALTIDSDTNGAFSSYHIVPNEYTEVAHKNAATSMDSSTGGATLTTTYAAYISKTQPADTYAGKVIYTLVHPSTAPAPVVCNPNGTTIGTNTSTDIKCMQDISSTNKSTILAAMTEGTQYTLTDKRDSKTYTVSKLADNNIWMTQNLDLDLDAGTTYTNLDTDLGWNTSTNTYDTASWSPERSTYATGTTTWGLYNETTGNHDGVYHPESYDPGNLYWNGTSSNYSDWNAYRSSCTYNSTTWVYEDCDESLNPMATYTTISGVPTPQYHLGNFYNWNAAIAINDSAGITDGTVVDQSICPVGWTLPIGGWFESNVPTKSFQYLVERYGWNGGGSLSNNRKIWQPPIYIGLSGGWRGILTNVGGAVYSWSSTAGYVSWAYALYVNQDYGGYVNPIYDDSRYSGNVVRCVAR